MANAVDMPFALAEREPVEADLPAQVRSVGLTSTGRFITVALDPTKHPAVWRPVTGWRSEAIEIASYCREYI